MDMKKLWPGSDVVEPSAESTRLSKVETSLTDLSSKFNTLLEFLTAPPKAQRKAQDAPAVKAAEPSKPVEKSFVTSSGYTVHKDPDAQALGPIRKVVWSYTHKDNTNDKMTNREAYEIISKYKSQGIKSFQGPAWKTTKAGLTTKRKPGRPSAKDSEISALLKQNAELIALLKSKA